MSATSPSPNSPSTSSGSAPPPATSSSPPPTPLSNANPPESTNTTVPSPPPQPSISPPIPVSPPPATPPVMSPPPPIPPAPSPPPPLLTPPESSPPPPLPVAPENPPQRSPPPPRRSPPPPAPEADPPVISPPPPATPIAPVISPPPPATPQPPETSPPPSSSSPPPVRNSPPPPRRTPPSPATPPPASSPPESSPVPPFTRPPPPMSPAPPSPVPVPNNPSPRSPESANSNGNGGIGAGGAAGIAVVAGFVVLGLIGLAFWCIRKRRKKVSGPSGHVMPSPMVSSPKSDSAFLKTHGSSSDQALGNSRPFFTFEELVHATNGFSNQNLLGEGGFGSVFKGNLPDGREIAVKQLKIGGGQGEREFQAEVEIISRIHHRHLVSLVGYCISDTRRLLVYEYVPNNNLYFHLHGEGQPVLEWATRVRVAAGSARGIAYLHEDCQPRVIHRDIKSSNILLDNNYEARVSDFGLAKLALEADTHITTRVMGTFGYMAPEYASSGKLTDKSDVYSFGVVLLELITGRKPVDSSQPLGDESLVEWARPLLSHSIESGEYDSLVDPKLEKNFTETEMLLMVEIAAACVRHSSAKRPRMGQVVRAFDSLGATDLTNGMRVGESEVFNSAQQSEEIRWFRRMAFGSQNYSTDFFSQNSMSKASRENSDESSSLV